MTCNVTVQNMIYQSVNFSQEMALRDSFREKVSQTLLRQRGPEELHHQQVNKCYH